MGNEQSAESTDAKLQKATGDNLQETEEVMTAAMRKLFRHTAKYRLNPDGSVTFFPTPNCDPAKKHAQPKVISSAIEQVLLDEGCSKLEAMSDSAVEVLGAPGRRHNKSCSFISAATQAWSAHHPLRLRPEHIWLLILQSTAVHVEQNAEKLREKFVQHQGKKELVVVRDGFLVGSAKNDWEGVVKEFVQQIDKSTVEDTCELLECDFSSTSLVETIAGKITVMDICKSYFDYTVRTMCGFPEITLDGTKADWASLREKAGRLLTEKVTKQFGQEWAAALLPVLDRFVAAFDGEIDCLFWCAFLF